MKNQDDLSSCAAKLTSAEFVLLKKLLDSVESKPQAEEKHLDKRKKENLDKRNLESPDKRKEGNLDKRTLKKQISDVSMDSKGYPACLKSPKRPLAIEDKNPLPKGNAKPKGPPTFLRRKIGQKAACQKQEVERDEDELKEAMGIKEVGKRRNLVPKK